MNRFVGMAVVLVSMASFAFAGHWGKVWNAPEIDASSGVAALGLLAGGMIVLRSRKRKA